MPSHRPEVFALEGNGWQAYCWTWRKGSSSLVDDIILSTTTGMGSSGRHRILLLDDLMRSRDTRGALQVAVEIPARGLRG